MSSNVSTSEPTTDAEVVRQVREGNREAYAHLVSRYQNAVYGVAYHHLHNFEDARDIAQEAFVQAYVRLEQLREPARFGAWVRQITVNQCYMWQWQRQVTEPLDTVASLAHEGHLLQVRPLEVRQIETRLVVQQALSCLSDASRLTLTLYYFQSYSLPEIAAFLEVPVTTVKSRLRNARARLHKELVHKELIQMVEETLKQEPLPPDFALRVVHTLMSSGAVHAVAFSPDARLLASTSIIADGWDLVAPRRDAHWATGEVHLWDVASGALVHTLEVPSSVYSVAYAPDGKTIAYDCYQPRGAWGMDFEIQLWDVERWDIQRVLQVPGGVVKAVAFAPDGRLLASSGAQYEDSPGGRVTGEVRLWQAESGALQRVLETPASYVTAITFSPDGSTLAGSVRHVQGGTGGDVVRGDVRLWSVETGEVRTVLELPESQQSTSLAEALVFSPDGSTLAVGIGQMEGGKGRPVTGGAVRLWDTQTGQWRHTLAQNGEAVHTVTFSPDGHLLVSGSRDGAVNLWNAATGELMRTVNEHATAVQAVAFSADGKILCSADSHRGVKVWTMEID